MRYELTDYEWIAIRPMLPNKPRGVPRVDDRRVLNGIFWVLRSGASWRDLPDDFGPYTTCYNRFVRWQRAGVWGRIMDALATAHDASVQMIDTSIVRVHQHGACIIRNRRQSMGRSRGGLTSKIHAVVDTNGLPVRLALTAGQAHDNRLADKLLSRLKSGSMLLADRGYDANGSEPLLGGRARWPIFRLDAIAANRSASARISIEPAIWSSGSSTRSSTVAGSQYAMTSWQRTTSLSSSLRQSGCGCALMSPRPRRPATRSRTKGGGVALRPDQGGPLTAARVIQPQEPRTGALAYSGRRRLDCQHRARPASIRNTLATPHEGDVDLQAPGKFAGRAAPTRSHQD